MYQFKSSSDSYILIDKGSIDIKHLKINLS